MLLHRLAKVFYCNSFIRILTATSEYLTRHHIHRGTHTFFLRPRSLVYVLAYLDLFLTTLFNFTLLLYIGLLLTNRLFSFFFTNRFFFSTFLKAFFIFLTRAFTTLFIYLSTLFVTLFTLFPTSFTTLTMPLHVKAYHLVSVSTEDLCAIRGQALYSGGYTSGRRRRRGRCYTSRTGGPIRPPNGKTKCSATTRPLLNTFRVRLPSQVVRQRHPPLGRRQTSCAGRRGRGSSHHRLRKHSPVSLVKGTGHSYGGDGCQRYVYRHTRGARRCTTSLVTSSASRTRVTWG